MSRAFAIALTVGAIAWVGALFAAAVHASEPFSAFLYGFASAVCHQRPERSFTFEGHQLPVCARCAGLYFSGALGALGAWLPLQTAPNRSRVLLIVAAVPTLLTIPIEWLGWSPLSNVIRAAAAVPLGAAAGWIFVRMLRAERRERHQSSAPVAL
jgi:uncharacterized membrane protein